MSHDLLIVGPNAPEGVPDEASLPDDLEIDGPYETDPDLLADEVLARVVAPRWEVALHARFTDASIRRARKVARQIADSCAGVVYDPQEDRVIWPRGSRRVVVTPSVERRARVLNLIWCFARRLTHEDAETFLAVAGRRMPECRPVRWGLDEPLRFRDEEGFREHWDGDEILWWKGRPPVFAGMLHPGRSSTRFGKRYPRLTDWVEIALDAEATVEASAEWVQAIEDLVVSVSEAMGAYVASAELQLTWTARRGTLWFDAPHGLDTGSVVAHTWLGLPNFPCWFMWLGPGYRELVAEDNLDGDAIASATPSGLLVRTAKTPAEQRSGAQVGMDPRLFRHGNQLETERVAELIPDVGWAPH